MINYDKILKGMPQNLNKFEISRYLYINLGKYFSYDPEYITTESDQIRKEIFDRGFEEVKDDKVVCTSLSRIYETLLKKCGINAKTVLIPGKRLGHGYTEIEIEGRNYFTGLIGDLANIKTGFRTKEFMIDDKERFGEDSEFSSLSDDELKEIDDKIGYTYQGMYIDEITKMLQKEMNLLDDVGNPEIQELRQQLGIEDLKGKDLLLYKINFIAQHMGHNELKCLEKKDYFENLVKSCLDGKEMIQNFNVSKITCIDNDKALRMFYVITDKENAKKTIYTLSDEGPITKVYQGGIQEMFKSGMKTLSKSREEELMNFLLEGAFKDDGEKTSDANIKLNEKENSAFVQSLRKQVATEIENIQLETETRRKKKRQEREI